MCIQYFFFSMLSLHSMSTSQVNPQNCFGISTECVRFVSFSIRCVFVSLSFCSVVYRQLLLFTFWKFIHICMYIFSVKVTKHNAAINRVHVQYMLCIYKPAMDKVNRKDHTNKCHAWLMANILNAFQQFYKQRDHSLLF